MPGGGMAGSFKSMVWDYYLPTDMHEAANKLTIKHYRRKNDISDRTHN